MVHGSLSEERRDEVARAAARLLRDGRAEDIAGAIRAALRGQAGADEVTVARVREHARGLAMEALGATGYRQHVAEVLERAEETMTLLATQLATRVGDAPVALVGRAARAQVDADPCCRIRVQSAEPIGIIAEVLVSAGVEEPSFSTVETLWGRLDQLRFDDEGIETRITRLPPAMKVALNADLRHEGTVPCLDVAAIRRLISILRQ